MQWFTLDTPKRGIKYFDTLVWGPFGPEGQPRSKGLKRKILILIIGGDDLAQRLMICNWSSEGYSA